MEKITLFTSILPEEQGNDACLDAGKGAYFFPPTKFSW